MFWSQDRDIVDQRAKSQKEGLTTNLCRPSYINTRKSVSVLDIFDNVGVDSPLEIGALTSKVIVILLRRRNSAVLAR
jgi:hypothetical protein